MIDLRHGDSRNLLKEVADESIDLIVTDPPYRVISGGCGYTPNHQRPSGILKSNDSKIFTHNDITFDEYVYELYAVLKSPGHLYMMVNFLNLEAALSALRGAGFEIHNLLVWEKNNATPNRWYMKNVEYTIFARKGPARAINDKGSKTCHRFNNITGNKVHPTEKPIDLMRFYIENSSQPGDLVLDPFFGSGATAIACKLSGRRFIGFEIDREYYEIAMQRLNDNDGGLFHGRT